MTIENVIDLAGLVIVAASLYFVALQTKTLTISNHAIVYQHISAEMMEIDRLFVDRPELRPYFYDQKPLPDEEPERSRVLALAELIADFADDFSVQASSIPARSRQGWIDYFVDLARTSPALRTYWRANRDWYEAELKDWFDEVCDEFAGVPGG